MARLGAVMRLQKYKVFKVIYSNRVAILPPMSANLVSVMLVSAAQAVELSLVLS